MDEPKDRRGGNGEYALLLEARGDLAGPASEERIRIEEGDLTELVGDCVVHPPLQPSASQQELLAPVANLQRPQTESGAVTRTGGVVAQPNLELGGWSLRQQQVQRSAVERIGSLGGAEPGIGKWRQGRKDDVRLAQYLCGVGVTAAREQPVLPIEDVLIGRDRQAQQREVCGPTVLGRSERLTERLT